MRGELALQAHSGQGTDLDLDLFSTSTDDVVVSPKSAFLHVSRARSTVLFAG
jgi:hypothetical protein